MTAQDAPRTPQDAREGDRCLVLLRRLVDAVQTFGETDESDPAHVVRDAMFDVAHEAASFLRWEVD